MKRFGVFGMAALCALAIHGVSPRVQAQSRDEQAIRAVVERYAAAFNAKDVDAIMKMYAPGNELFVFDMVPPRQYVGWDAYKKDWQSTLASIPGPVKFDVGDLTIVTGGKLAYAHSIQHAAWNAADGSPQELTVRVTDVYRKIDGRWLIVHEHVSVPVDFTTGKADLLSKP